MASVRFCKVDLRAMTAEISGGVAGIPRVWTCPACRHQEPATGGESLISEGLGGDTMGIETNQERYQRMLDILPQDPTAYRFYKECAECKKETIHVRAFVGDDAKVVVQCVPCTTRARARSP